MLASIYSIAVVGLSTVTVTVEVDVMSQGLPAFTIVGLPDKAVDEARERVRSAVLNSGAYFPDHRVVVNLAPADLPKVGPVYDLPIAVGILVGSGQISASVLDALFIGELSLEGTVRATQGILPTVLHAKDKGFKRVFLPRRNGEEASIVQNMAIYPVDSLVTLVQHLQSETGTIVPLSATDLSDKIRQLQAQEVTFDFADVRGQEKVKRALEIAAAGGHNVLMKGPPGSGKTMLARAFSNILPMLTTDEALEVTKIYSIAGQLHNEGDLILRRPFRSPHHTISNVGLVGGGQQIRPGEVSLAHRGVLFLDEFPEFARSALEALRQPLEDGFVSITRASGAIIFPARFTLIAAQNPCPCGYFGSSNRPCTCSMFMIKKYTQRVSGPILDRIDIHVEVPAVDVEKLGREKILGEPSIEIAQRAQKARHLQAKRYHSKDVVCNGEMQLKHIRIWCEMPAEVERFLTASARTLNLSARAFYKLLRVARTIADLEERDEICTQDVAEALQYRRTDA